MLSETGLVSRIRKLAAAQKASPALVKGIGDDCAILRPRPEHDLVFTSDFVLEGRHFTLETHTPSDIGHKALARSLSDLAAMGSKPLFCLVSLAIPPSLGRKFVNGFYRGFLGLAAQHQIVLAGGDLASFDRVVADVVCCGEVPLGKALLRSCARPGAAIYVTGDLGASAAGFEAGRGRNFRRHLRPEPRVTVGQALRRLGVKCCMDLSDGLALDLQRLCTESKVSAELDPALPIAPGATKQQALSGGEDYELLFTAPKNLHLPRAIKDCSLTEVGRIVTRTRTPIMFAGRALQMNGFDHFRSE